MSLLGLAPLVNGSSDAALVDIIRDLMGTWHRYEPDGLAEFILAAFGRDGMLDSCLVDLMLLASNSLAYAVALLEHGVEDVLISSMGGHLARKSSRVIVNVLGSGDEARRMMVPGFVGVLAASNASVVEEMCHACRAIARVVRSAFTAGRVLCFLADSFGNATLSGRGSALWAAAWLLPLVRGAWDAWSGLAMWNTEPELAGACAVVLLVCGGDCAGQLGLGGELAGWVSPSEIHWGRVLSGSLCERRLVAHVLRQGVIAGGQLVAAVRAALGMLLGDWDDADAAEALVAALETAGEEDSALARCELQGALEVLRAIAGTDREASAVVGSLLVDLEG